MESQFLFWPRSFVSVEALGLLKIAEIVGMRIDEEFAFCPREARLPVTNNIYMDLFTELERALASDRQLPS